MGFFYENKEVVLFRKATDPFNKIFIYNALKKFKVGIKKKYPYLRGVVIETFGLIKNDIEKQ